MDSLATTIDSARQAIARNDYAQPATITHTEPSPGKSHYGFCFSRPANPGDLLKNEDGSISTVILTVYPPEGYGQLVIPSPTRRLRTVLHALQYGSLSYGDLCITVTARRSTLDYIKRRMVNTATGTDWSHVAIS